MNRKNVIPHLLILAGGLGTRLSSVVSDVPKALAPVGDASFLEILIEVYRQQGVQRFTFLLGYRAEQIIDEIDRLSRTSLAGSNYDYVVEPFALGTGGAVANAVRCLKLKKNFLVTNSDTYVKGAIDPLVCAGPNSIGVLFMSDTRRFGLLDIDDDGTVLSFVEKSNQKISGFVNSGICLLKPDLFEMWRGQPFSLEYDVLARLALKGQLRAVPLVSPFCDIGVPDSYFQFKQAWEFGDDKL